MSKQDSANYYHQMLGLPENVKQPDLYQLLGVAQFTNDTNAIHNAALDQNGKLQGWQNSNEHHKTARQLMMEVAEARSLLLDAEKKATYDRQLQNENAPAASTTETLKAADPSDRSMDWLTDGLEESVETLQRKPRRLPPKKSPRQRKSRLKLPPRSRQRSSRSGATESDRNPRRGLSLPAKPSRSLGAISEPVIDGFVRGVNSVLKVVFWILNGLEFLLVKSVKSVLKFAS